MGNSLDNNFIFMTGATSGLGKISALKAASEGATVIALGRKKEKSALLIEDYKSQFPKGLGKIEVVEGELNSFDSVVSACNQVRLKYPVIDSIVNNAGIMNFKPTPSLDNIEETLQVNLLSPLLICHLLFENLLQSKNPRIIFTSSALHQGIINFENLEFQNNFSSFKVYRQSKLGVILVCRALAEPLKKHNINIYSQHPGMVRTELGRTAGWISRVVFFIMGKSPEKGSQTLSYLIETNTNHLTSGEYYADKKIAPTTPQSYDLAVGEKLMTVANEYLRPYIKTNSPFFKVK